MLVILHHEHIIIALPLPALPLLPPLLPVSLLSPSLVPFFPLPLTLLVAIAVHVAFPLSKLIFSLSVVLPFPLRACDSFHSIDLLETLNVVGHARDDKLLAE